MMPYVSKGTISRWLANIELTDAQRQELESRSSKGRLRASATIRLKKQLRLKSHANLAKELFKKHYTDTFFIAGLVLYWAEGTKTTESVHFMNSDPRLVLLMLKWARKYLNVPLEKIKARLFIHKIYAHENHEQFWNTIIKIPKNNFLKTIYKPTPHTIKKNPSYRGCVRLDAGGVREFYMIESWKKLFSEEHNLALVV